MGFDALGTSDLRFDVADLLPLDRARDGAVHSAPRPLVGDVVEGVDAALNDRRIGARERRRKLAEGSRDALGFTRLEKVCIGFSCSEGRLPNSLAFDPRFRQTPRLEIIFSVIER